MAIKRTGKFRPCGHQTAGARRATTPPQTDPLGTQTTTGGELQATTGAGARSTRWSLHKGAACAVSRLEAEGGEFVVSVVQGRAGLKYPGLGPALGGSGSSKPRAEP